MYVYDGMDNFELNKSSSSFMWAKNKEEEN